MGEGKGWRLYSNLLSAIKPRCAKLTQTVGCEADECWCIKAWQVAYRRQEFASAEREREGAAGTRGLSK